MKCIIQQEKTDCKLKLEGKLEKQVKLVNGEDKGDSKVGTQTVKEMLMKTLRLNCYYDKLNHSLIKKSPMMILENGEQPSLKKEDQTPKHLESHFIQTVITGVMEAELTEVMMVKR